MASSTGNRKVTIKDVASVAKVSTSVVSRVLSEDATLRIRDDTRERVLRVITGMGYSANATARSLRLSRTNLFGLITHDLTNPIYAEIMRGAFEAGTKSGYSMVMTDADEVNRNLNSFNALVRGHQVDGILLLRSTGASDRYLANISSSFVPTVLLMDSARPGVSTISMDDKRSVQAGVRHLINLGHRRIGHLTGLKSWRSDDRHQGYLDAMHEAGVRPDPSWIGIGGWTAAAGREGMMRLMANRPRSAQAPTAIFVSNTLAALGALSAARELRLVVPQALSVASLHDTWLADLVTPTLTTVRTPLAELGRRAVNILVDQQQFKMDVNDLVPTRPVIIQRQSTGPPLT